MRQLKEKRHVSTGGRNSFNIAMNREKKIVLLLHPDFALKRCKEVRAARGAMGMTPISILRAPCGQSQTTMSSCMEGQVLFFRERFIFMLSFLLLQTFFF